MKRVVVTGVGPLCSIGIGAEAFLKAQHEAKNGIRHTTRFDPIADNVSCHMAGEVDVEVTDYIDKKEAKRMDRFVQMALISSDLAVQDAGLSAEEIAGERSGACLGTGIGGLDIWEKQTKIRFDRDVSRVTPFFIPMLIPNMASGHVSMRHGMQGPSSAVITACSSGSGSIGDAYRIIERDEADIMIAGGTEASITTMGVGGFANMKAMSTRNDSPETASRPFCLSRDGFIAGEGAGLIVLEEYEHAKARGARIYAEIIGYATSADAHHITSPAPGGAGAVRCVNWALRSAKIDADKIGYINAHGTSTPANDKNETMAYKTVFGEKDTAPPISSTKSMVGHMLGAAGGIEAIATVQALHSGVLPPTRNYIDPDPELDLDYVPNEAREQQVEYALSNNFAFGGQNASLIFKKV